MLLSNLIKNTLKQSLDLNSKRFYTCIVERVRQVPIVKKGKDVRSRNLRSDHYQLRLVECTHNNKWGNVDVILTEYVEGKLFSLFKN